MFMFTDAQIEQIRVLLEARQFASAYRLAADLAEGGEGVPQASILWLRGAANVNESVGSQSAFIRSYTSNQYYARYGETLDMSLLQEASDAIAENVLKKIIADRIIPSVDVIAREDAQPAATKIFKGDPGGWAGNPLFLFLGHDAALQNNVLENPADTYDALAMIKFLGATDDWWTNLWEAWGTATETGSRDMVISAGLRVDQFLVNAYGGFATAGRVLADEVVLGRVNAGDVLSGTDGTDFMHGSGGNDTLVASMGDDIMDGGADIDRADFSGSFSKLNVIVKAISAPTTHVATVVANEGTDALYNIEEIVGSKSDDFFQIQSFSTGVRQLTLDGSDGIDLLSAFYLPGSIEVDNVAGTFKGDGRTLGIRNFERFEGGNQDDTFFGSGAEKEINGRGGKDTVDFTKATSPVSVGTPWGVILKNIETVIGSNGADIILGDAQSNRFEGGKGSDLLIGGGGKNTLMGGDGADYLLADGDAATTIDGGAGSDYLEATGSGPVTYVFGKGSGHDVLASLFVPDSPGNSPAYRAAGAWLSQRQNDRIVFKDLMPDDLILEWDYTERAIQTDYEEVETRWPDPPWDPSNRDEYSWRRWGAAAIRIAGTDDTLYLGNLHAYESKYSGELSWQYVGYVGLTGLFVQKGAIGLPARWQIDLKIFEFKDGSVLSITDLFDFFGARADIVRNALPSAYSDAASQYAAGSTPSSADASAASGRINGGAGNDVLTGSSGNDVIMGYNGNDTITSGAGDDVVLCGDGADRVILDDTGSDYYNGGAGCDLIDLEGLTMGVVVDLAVGTARGSAIGQDKVTGFENVFGGAGGDSLTGDGGGNWLKGNGGNDTLVGGLGPDLLEGGSGNDFLYGGAGNDTLDGGTGADLMDGGADDDTYDVDDAGDRVIEVVGGGIDTVYTSVSYSIAGTDVENLSVREGAISLRLTGNTLANSIWGSAGDDTLDGGAGADLLGGGEGNDVYYVDNAGDRIGEYSDGGYDIVRSSVHYTLEADAAIERLEAADPISTAALRLTGNKYAQTLVGNAGANTLLGMGGNDMLDGRNGNDRLDGGEGSDSLIGGLGQDIFIFRDAAFSVDQIFDFNQAEDKIWLDDAVFTALKGLGGTEAAPVMLKAEFFTVGEAAKDADDHIIYNQANGLLYYDADGVGGSAQIAFARLPAGPLLKPVNIWVI